MVHLLSVSKRFSVRRLKGDRVRVIDRETGQRAYYQFSVRRHLQSGDDNQTMQTVAYHWFAAMLANRGQVVVDDIRRRFGMDMSSEAAD